MILAMTILLNDPYLINELYENLNFTINKFINEPNQSNLFKEYSNITSIPEDIFERYQNYINTNE